MMPTSLRGGLFAAALAAVALLIPAPAEAAPVAGSDLVARETVNLRSGPGQTFRVLSVLSRGRHIVATAPETGGWVPVRFEDRPAYVSARYLVEPGSVTTSAVPAAYVGSPGETALAFAREQLGKPYRYGAVGPSAYDCSGLALAAWHAAGVDLPRTSQQQFAAGHRITREELQPGDLVFFYGSRPGHVALYVGNGQVIHAPRPGKAVQYTSLDSMPFSGAVRPGLS